MSKTADYTLYMVTDSTPAILGSRSLVQVVEEAVKGGVTIVQYRRKSGETKELIEEVKQIHDITRKYGVPLLVNDRVDVAVAAKVEGVHIGQDDIDIHATRELLNHLDDPIIGVTASTLEEALQAAEDGASYVGLGTVFATPTKDNTKHIIGPTGIHSILTSLKATATANGTTPIKSVAIGGINASNVQRVLYQSSPADNPLNGVAVVSALVAAADPRAEAEKLRKLIASPPPFARHTASKSTEPLMLNNLKDRIPKLVAVVSKANPLCHNMTNTVVQNMAANIALALGGSPIMAGNGAEAADLASIPNASLVVNMGTSSGDALAHYSQAIRAYNNAGAPILFDPVGGGATAIRRNAVKTLLNAGWFDVIKGNEGEIGAVYGAQGPQQKGVDGGNHLSLEDKVALAEALSRRSRSVVALTGAVDVLTDGTRTVLVRNGHPYLGSITGAGCTLGTTIGAFLAVHAREGDVLEAVLAGIVLFEIAAERAAAEEQVNGPGSFIPAWIDQLYNLTKVAEDGNAEWANDIKVEFR